MSGKARSERWRERRRKGLMSLTIDVSPAQRCAFERMGLISTGRGRDKEAVAWAVKRFLDTAPAVQGIGDALYPDAEDFMGEGGEAARDGAEMATTSSGNSDGHEG